MIVVEFRKDLFHDGLTEENRLCANLEFFTVEIDGSHFAIIEIYDLPVATHKRLLLLLEIFRINA